MQRSRSRRRKSKKKKVKKKCVDERETLSYEQEIVDLNRQLARLRSRNEELELDAEATKGKFQKLEEDRADIIAYLKRTLEEKIEESRELSERLTALEELRKEELAAYKKKEEAMDQEYRTMENNLSAEVKLAAGKLNALEDWRLARLDLIQKFENQEQEMAEQEKRHKEQLYEAEKSVVVGKAMLQKEMKEHLQILSERLLTAITLRITDVMNRTIRENVALNRDLDKLMKNNRELETVNVERKKTEQTLRLKCELFETETEIVLKKTLKQRNAIHQIVEEFQLLLARYTDVERSNTRLSTMQAILEDIIKRKDEILNVDLKECEKNVVKAREENKRLLETIHEQEGKMETLKDILNRASSFLNEALQVAEEAYSKNQCLGCMGPSMLQTLLEILETEDIVNAVDYTASELDDIDCKYAMGCLGLIQPVKEKKIKKKMEEEKEEEIVQEEESVQSFEKVPSCLLSDISSSVESPKELENELQDELEESQTGSAVQL
ncbi:golgin subfamily A member 4 [Ceratina calcarata]|uniref:Cilia- and flagella-associated protein 157 n=1 Tax=Ceratina calcarata TaxID=156304 RepID=A0AAJ7IU67_9HYME|nr:golgin subfamily A member 4 [Ceratina calcarata]